MRVLFPVTGTPSSTAPGSTVCEVRFLGLLPARECQTANILETFSHVRESLALRLICMRLRSCIHISCSKRFVLYMLPKDLIEAIGHVGCAQEEDGSHPPRSLFIEIFRVCCTFSCVAQVLAKTWRTREAKISSKPSRNPIPSARRGPGD